MVRSPTINAVTMPLPIFCQPTSVTFAAFSMASLASTNVPRYSRRTLIRVPAPTTTPGSITANGPTVTPSPSSLG
jgi:hypothetical protein